MERDSFEAALAIISQSVGPRFDDCGCPQPVCCRGNRRLWDGEYLDGFVPIGLAAGSGYIQVRDTGESEQKQIVREAETPRLTGIEEP